MKELIFRIFENYGSLVGTLLIVVIPSIIVIILIQYILYCIKVRKRKGNKQ